MATTMIAQPPTPGPGAPAVPVVPGDPVRFVAIRANLMPAEVIEARRIDAVRRRVLIGLGLLLVLLIAGYGSAWLQTSSAESDLADVQHQASALQAQQQAYSPLVAAQARTAAIQDQLTQLMVGDVRWQNMLAAVRGDAPTGVDVTSVSSQISTTTAPGSTAAGGLPGYGALATGATPIGTLTLVGTAGDKDQVAAYSDRLANETGLASPVISSVVATARPFTFTIAATLTSDALGGRYHVANPTTQEGN